MNWRSIPISGISHVFCKACTSPESSQCSIFSMAICMGMLRTLLLTTGIWNKSACLNTVKSKKTCCDPGINERNCKYSCQRGKLALSTCSWQIDDLWNPTWMSQSAGEVLNLWGCDLLRTRACKGALGWSQRDHHYSQAYWVNALLLSFPLRLASIHCLFHARLLLRRNQGMSACLCLHKSLFRPQIVAASNSADLRPAIVFGCLDWGALTCSGVHKWRGYLTELQESEIVGSDLCSWAKMLERLQDIASRHKTNHFQSKFSDSKPGLRRFKSRPSPACIVSVESSGQLPLYFMMTDLQLFCRHWARDTTHNFDQRATLHRLLTGYILQNKKP